MIQKNKTSFNDIKKHFLETGCIIASLAIIIGTHASEQDKSGNRSPAKVTQSFNDDEITNIPSFSVAIAQEEEKHELVNYNCQLAYGEETNSDRYFSSSATKELKQPVFKEADFDNGANNTHYNESHMQTQQAVETHKFLDKLEKECAVDSDISPLPKVLSKAEKGWIDWEKIEAEEKEQQEVWLHQQSLFGGYNATGPTNLVTDAFSHLGLNERPSAFGQRTYIEEPNGRTTFTHYKHEIDPLQVKNYGLSPTQGGYVAEDNIHHRETFTSTLPKGQTYKAGRKHPFEAFSLDIKGEKIHFDAGHGIDQADTVLANGRNSSTDPSNFVPQNRYYNQKIRNHIVNHEVRKQTSGSYKEISVYDDTDPLIHILSNGEKCHIPIGFIFIIFSDRNVAKAFYFPNLVSYEKLIQTQNITRNYRSFMDYFEIPAITVDNEAIKMGDTDRHVRAINGHAYKGYRSLSGRFDVVGHIEMPNPAKAALRRFLANYHMEQAAHLEFRCVEQKAQLVEIFTSKMKYHAFDRATEQEQKERTTAYWQAYKDEEQNLAASPNGIACDLVDYAIHVPTFLLRMGNQISPDDPRELALKRVQERQKDLEAGESLYNPERAKLWLARIEECVRLSPKIEDIIRLLNLYEIPEIQDLEKKRIFETLLEEQGKEASLEEQKDIGDYFYSQLKNTDRGTEADSLQRKVDSWKAIVEKRVDESTSIEDLTQAAEWYHGGRGMFDQNAERAREIYQTLLPFVDLSEKCRIQRCLEDLVKIEKHAQTTTRAYSK